jgi:hypothetical protein
VRQSEDEGLWAVWEKVGGACVDGRVGPLAWLASVVGSVQVLALVLERDGLIRLLWCASGLAAVSVGGIAQKVCQTAHSNGLIDL